VSTHGPDPIRASLHLDDAPVLRLILVRHGQQIPPVPGGTIKDQRDPPLTELGRRQKAVVADALAGEDVDAVYCSNLERAHQTGIEIASRHGQQPTVMKELREIEIGRDRPDDLPLTELIGEDAWAEARSVFSASQRWDDFPMSEPSDDFRTRVSGAFEAIRAAHATGVVVVACHGGVINAIVSMELGIDADLWFMPAHCSIHRLRVRPGRMVVQNLNETEHLMGDLETY
jgi:probable phosphoglycerate mutase